MRGIGTLGSDTAAEGGTGTMDTLGGGTSDVTINRGNRDGIAGLGRGVIGSAIGGQIGMRAGGVGGGWTARRRIFATSA